MIMQNILAILTVIVTAMVKFLFTGLVSYGLGFTFMETFIYMAIGSSLGMAIFYLAGRRVLEWFRQRFIRRSLERKAKGLPPKRVFTRTNRMIVKLKGSYGLFGLAVLAPPTLSVPITAVVAAKYFRHDRRTLPTLLISVIIWSVVLSAAWGGIR